MDIEQARDKIVNLWDNLKLGDYTYQDLVPNQYSWLGDLAATPMTAANVNTATYSAPVLDAGPTAGLTTIGNFNPYSTQGYDAFIGEAANLNTADEAAMRNRQLAGLDRWQDLARDGLSHDEMSAVRRVQDAAAQARRQAESSILADMAERGTLGSGSELAARMAAGQAGQNLAAAQGDSLADLILARQTQAAGAADQLAGSIRSGDVDVASRQAALFDSFQQRKEAITNAARQYQAQKANEANAWAAGANASAAAQNAAAANENSQFNTTNEINRRLYNNQNATAAAQWNAGQQNENNRLASGYTQAANLWNAQNKADVTRTNFLGRQQTANDNTNLLNNASETNFSNRTAITGLQNNNKLQAVSGYSNALNGVGNSLAASQAAQAANSTARTNGWITAGLGTLGVLGNMDKIANGVKTIAGWF